MGHEQVLRGGVSDLSGCAPMTVRIVHADCLSAMREMGDNTVDAVVTP